MNKEIKVSGRIPMSVRKQVGKGKKKRIRKTLKHKRIKKIRTPRKQNTIPTIPSMNNSSSKSMKPIVHKDNLQKPGNVKGILQMGKDRKKHKTVKKVRFNLESGGVQIGKFRNAQRVKMKTAKRNSINRRFKNRTLKNKRFKIRFSDDQVDNVETDDVTPDLNLVTRLKNFNEKASSDISIARV